MKKRIAIFGLALVAVLMSVMFVFTACKRDEEPTNVEPSAATLEDMITNIDLDHKNNVSTSTPASYQLAAQTVVGKEIAYVKWTAKVDTEGANADDVKVSDVENKFVTVIINDKSPLEIEYTLTATLTNADGVEYKREDGSLYTASFKHSVPAYTVVDWAGFKANCEFNSNSDNKDNKQTITVKGYIIGIVSTTSSSKGSIYLQDAQGYGYYAYKPKDVVGSITDDAALRAAWPVGTEIEVTGTGTIYGGQYEFEANCVVQKTGNSINASELTYKNVTEAWGAAADNKDTALIPYQNALAVLDGCKLTGSDGSYYYFTVNGVEFNIYKNNYFMTDAEVTEMLNKYAIGKKATIKGLVSCYSGKYQIYPVGADCISKVEDAVFTADEKIESVKKELDIKSAILADTTIDLPAAGVSFTDVAITWAFKGETVPATAKIENNKLVITQNESEETFTLTATLTCGDKTVDVDFEIKVNAIEFSKFKAITAPVAGEYKMSITQGNLGKVLYLDGKVNSSGYMTTTENPAEAATVVLAAAENDNEYTLAVNGQFIEVYLNADGKARLKLADTSAVKWNWDDSIKIFTCTLEGKVYYVGTYNTFNTASVSETSYITGANASKIGKSQFLAYLGNVEANTALSNTAKVNYEKAFVDFKADTTKVSSTGSLFNDVTISWTSDNAAIVIADNGDVTVGSVVGVVNVKITATITCGDITATKEFDIALGKVYENKVEGATISTYAELAALVPNKNDTTTEKFWTMGTVTEITNATYGNAVIKNTDGGEFVIYGMYDVLGNRYDKADAAKKPVVGDFVVLYGTLKNFNGTIEMINATILQINDDVIVVTATEKIAKEKDALAFTAETKTVALKGKTFADVEIEWSSDNTAIAIATDGAVTVSNVDADTTVTVTATLKCGDQTESKTFSIALKKFNPDAPVLTKATITFDDTTKRTVLSNEQQVWTENGITVTNDKAKSSNNVADYANPVRLYKDSSLKIEVGGKAIKKIVFNTNSKHLTYTGAEGQTVTGSGATGTTIEFSTGVTEFTIVMPAQVRVNSIEVTALCQILG